MLNLATHNINLSPALKRYCTSTVASPFGSSLPNRAWSDVSRGYRYGFNGKEKDTETTNDEYDFGARIYDVRLGRWLSVDPESSEYPSMACYMGMGNNPILCVDLDGNKIILAYAEPKKDANGNFITDPVSGNLVMDSKYFEYKPGQVIPDNEFIKKAVESLDYLNQSKAGRRTIKSSIKNPREITIVEIDPHKQYMSSSKFEGTHSEPFEGELKSGGFQNNVDNNGKLIFANMIYWDPSLMCAVLDNNGNPTGKFQSASLILGHELRHIFKANKNPMRSLKLKSNSFEQNSKYKGYGDKEERRIIRWERRVARQLNRKHNNEGIRFNWKGRDASNKGDVKSTEGISVPKLRIIMPDN